MPITITLITRGLHSALPKPPVCNIVAANIIVAEPNPFSFLLRWTPQARRRAFRRLLQIIAKIAAASRGDGPRSLQPLRFFSSGGVPRTTRAPYKLLNPIALRPDLQHNARASQMRISLGSQTR